MPPLTCIVSPVIYDAASDDKKATVFETSSPDPSLDIGILEVKTALTLSTILSVILDLINPGDTIVFKKITKEQYKNHNE